MKEEFCPTCNKEIKSDDKDKKCISIDLAGMAYTGYICKDCYETVTLGDLIKSQL